MPSVVADGPLQVQPAPPQVQPAQAQPVQRVQRIPRAPQVQVQQVPPHPQTRPPPPPSSILTSSTNAASFESLACKSHEKAIGRVFTYNTNGNTATTTTNGNINININTNTNGSEVDTTSLADPRPDQVRHLTNGTHGSSGSGGTNTSANAHAHVHANANSSYSSLPNGGGVGSTTSLHSTKEKNASKPSSLHSIASSRAKGAPAWTDGGGGNSTRPLNSNAETAMLNGTVRGPEGGEQQQKQDVYQHQKQASSQQLQQQQQQQQQQQHPQHPQQPPPPPQQPQQHPQHPQHPPPPPPQQPQQHPQHPQHPPPPPPQQPQQQPAQSQPQSQPQRLHQRHQSQPTLTDPNLLSPTSYRALPSNSRLSSASDGSPNVSPRASLQDKQSAIGEMPRLTQRHTLSVPKVSTNSAQLRSSREFSFTAGPSEEVLYASGRMSPSHDHTDSPVVRARRASLGLVRRRTRSMQSEAYLDDIPQDEDAARWTEVIRQKRASRRKRREEDDDDDDRVMVGRKVEEGHVNWVTAYNMLTGIRFTVSRTNAKLDRELTEADFDAKHKFRFDVTGNELTPSAKYDFKFKDYAPWVFRHLRAIFGLDPADYLMSLTSKYILSELGSPGKSGSFFYFSRDYKYIIKTIHHAEHKLLRKILRDYYRHVLDNPNTLISQIYGLHRVKIPYGRKIHFLVMNNLFPPHRDIHQTFDLKGSTVGRDYEEGKLAGNPRATLKDLNWLRRDYHLEFDLATKEIFLDQLKRDVGLLQRLHIMDYSLLVGIHDLAKGNEENLRETTLQVFHPGGGREGEDSLTNNNAMLTRTPSRLENARKARELRLTLKKERPVALGLKSKMPEEMPSDDLRHDRIFYRDDGGIRGAHQDGSPGEAIYYLGIIDCLTHYGFVKHVENFWKGMKDDRNKISPIPPQAYGERFLHFITSITLTPEEIERRRTQESARSGGPNAAVAPHRFRPHSRTASARLSHDTPQFQFGVSSADGPHPELSSAGAAISPPGSPRDKAMRKQQPYRKDTGGSNSSGGGAASDLERQDRISTIDSQTTDLLPAVSEEKESASEGPMATPTRDGIRMISASTKRDSLGREIVELDNTSHASDTRVDREELEVFGEKSVSVAEPEDDSSSFGRRQPPVGRPPRLNSDLIPRMSPVWPLMETPTNAPLSSDIQSGGGDPEKPKRE